MVSLSTAPLPCPLMCHSKSDQVCDAVYRYRTVGDRRGARYVLLSPEFMRSLLADGMDERLADLVMSGAVRSSATRPRSVPLDEVWFSWVAKPSSSENCATTFLRPLGMPVEVFGPYRTFRSDGMGDDEAAELAELVMAVPA